MTLPTEENKREALAVAGASFAIIVAAGNGRRAGGGMPKQFRHLCGRPVFIHAVEAFLRVCPATHIIVVTHPDYASVARDALEALRSERDFRYTLVGGGETRAESVSNGLTAVNTRDCDALVAVHDGARPLVTERMIRDGWETAARDKAAVAVVPVTDSLRRILPDGNTEAVDRSRYLAVQTPQVFSARLLKGSYAQADYGAAFTDDASLVESLGVKVSPFTGDHENIKITNPEDFAIAELLLRRRADG